MQKLNNLFEKGGTTTSHTVNGHEIELKVVITLN